MKIIKNKHFQETQSKKVFSKKKESIHETPSMSWYFYMKEAARIGDEEKKIEIKDLSK